ncbi:hypothetical protein [Haliea salexigens]|uniref:hypothetical protein n=1 Tax=Haliea salexigens TaxID=287487 RepID=UPI000407C6DC|nr:hypothetical protein [Haliea salexigens]
MVSKEFGRYSAADLLALTQQLRSVESDLAELRGFMTSLPGGFAEHLTPPFFWATFYKVPFLDLVAWQLKLLSLESKFAEVAQTSDPHVAILSQLKGFEPEVDPENAKYILGIAMALRGNLRSMCFYSKSLEELTKEVEKGNDGAFFDAILIDRTILTCPPFADRMALAEYQGDEEFFQKVSKRLRQGAPTKKMKPYAPLRVCLYVLEQENCLASLTEKRAYELFCQELKLYPDDVEGDASRSLKRLIQRWQSDRAT